MRDGRPVFLLHPSAFILLLKLHFLAMKLTVNGDSREVDVGETARTLVQRYGLDPQKVAVELNRRLLKSDRYDEPLKEGDEIEIVTFVGGG
jgi:thiamine biosynthesis protein ThiS